MERVNGMGQNGRSCRFCKNRVGRKSIAQHWPQKYLCQWDESTASQVVYSIQRDTQITMAGLAAKFHFGTCVTTRRESATARGGETNVTKMQLLISVEYETD